MEHHLQHREFPRRFLPADIDLGSWDAIAQQFAASRKALEKAYQQMLACLLEEALLTPEQSPAEALAQVRAIFTKYT